MKSPFLKLLAAGLPIIMLIVLFTYDWISFDAQDFAVAFFTGIASLSVPYWVWVYFFKPRI